MSYTSHYHKAPVATTLDEVVSLPLFSIIDVDGVLYEKNLNDIFREFANPSFSTLHGTIAEAINGGTVSILRVGP